MRSIVHANHRFRAVANRVFVRPPNETLHEFLAQTVAWTFGEVWWKHQRAMGAQRQHVVVSWHESWQRLGATGNAVESDTRFSVIADGPSTALLTLGYDLYTLSSRNALPGSLVERMRSHNEFQSARYELAVAAIMMRAGFEVEFFDETKVTRKHCEFIAYHTKRQLKVAVEAKSRVRAGAYHDRGTVVYEEDVRGLMKLVSGATKQGERDASIALLIFVDVNVPPSPGCAIQQLPWVEDMNSVFDQLEARDMPTEWSAIVATNFGYHFGREGEPASPAEVGMSQSPNARVALPRDVCERLVQQALAHKKLPEEI